MTIPVRPIWAENGSTTETPSPLLLAVAPAIAAAGVGERRGGGAEVLRLLMQGRLIVLELDDQVEPGMSGGFECFFVTPNHPLANVRVESPKQQVTGNR